MVDAYTLELNAPSFSYPELTLTISSLSILIKTYLK
jgi:hypothetical protein